MDGDTTLTDAKLAEEAAQARALVKGVTGQFGICLWLSLAKGVATGRSELLKEWETLGDRIVDLLEFTEQ